MMADHDPNRPTPVAAPPPAPYPKKPSAWLRLTVGILPDDDNKLPSHEHIAKAIGEAFGPWTMIYGLSLEPISPPDRDDAIKISHAKWPDSRHIAPHAIPAWDARVLLNGAPSRVPCRVLSEDEYQLLLAGFIAAGGKL